MGTKKSGKKSNKAKAGMKISDRPWSEPARRIIECDHVADLIGAIEDMTRQEMRSALIDLGVSVAAQRMTERRA